MSLKTKDETIHKKFVELRAQGIPYRQIQAEIGVSRPTLIKWSRLYAKEIARERKRLERKHKREAEKREEKLTFERAKLLLKLLESERK